MTTRLEQAHREMGEALDSLGSIANGMMSGNATLGPDALFALGDQIAGHLVTLGWDDSPPWKPTGPQTPDLPMGMQP